MAICQYTKRDRYFHEHLLHLFYYPGKFGIYTRFFSRGWSLTTRKTSQPTRPKALPQYMQNTVRLCQVVDWKRDQLTHRQNMDTENKIRWTDTQTRRHPRKKYKVCTCTTFACDRCKKEFGPHPHDLLTQRPGVGQPERRTTWQDWATTILDYHPLRGGETCHFCNRSQSGSSELLRPQTSEEPRGKKEQRTGDTEGGDCVVESGKCFTAME